MLQLFFLSQARSTHCCCSVCCLWKWSKLEIGLLSAAAEHLEVLHQLVLGGIAVVVLVVEATAAAAAQLLVRLQTLPPAVCIRTASVQGLAAAVGCVLVLHANHQAEPHWS